LPQKFIRFLLLIPQKVIFTFHHYLQHQSVILSLQLSFNLHYFSVYPTFHSIFSPTSLSPPPLSPPLIQFPSKILLFVLSIPPSA